MGVLEEIFNPAAYRARQELDRQKEIVVAVPSPGDRMLSEGKFVIEAIPIGESEPIG